MQNRFSESTIKHAETLLATRQQEALSVAIEDFHPIEVIDYLVEVKRVPWVQSSQVSYRPNVLPTTYAIRAGRLDVLMWLMNVKCQPLDGILNVLDAVLQSIKTECFLWLMNRHLSPYSWEKLIDFIAEKVDSYYLYVPFFANHIENLLFQRNIETYLVMLNRQIICEGVFKDSFVFYYKEMVETAVKKATVLAKDRPPLLDLLKKYGGSAFDEAAKLSVNYDPAVNNRATQLILLHGEASAVKSAIRKEDTLAVIKCLVEVHHCCLLARDEKDNTKFDWHIMHDAIDWARIDILNWLVDEKGFEWALNGEERFALLKRALMDSAWPVIDSMVWLIKRYPDDCAGEKLNKLLDDCEPLSPNKVFDARVKLLIEQEQFADIEALCLARLASESHAAVHKAAKLVLAKLLLEAKLGFVGNNNPLVREGVVANEMYRAVQGYYFVRDGGTKESKTLKEKFGLVLSRGRMGGVEVWEPDAAQYFARFSLYMMSPADEKMNVIIRRSLPLDASPLFQLEKKQRVGEVVSAVEKEKAPSPAMM